MVVLRWGDSRGIRILSTKTIFKPKMIFRCSHIPRQGTRRESLVVNRCGSHVSSVSSDRMVAENPGPMLGIRTRVFTRHCRCVKSHELDRLARVVRKECPRVFNGILRCRVARSTKAGLSKDKMRGEDKRRDARYRKNSNRNSLKDGGEVT